MMAHTKNTEGELVWQGNLVESYQGKPRSPVGVPAGSIQEAEVRLQINNRTLRILVGKKTLLFPMTSMIGITSNNSTTFAVHMYHEPPSDPGCFPDNILSVLLPSPKPGSLRESTFMSYTFASKGKSAEDQIINIDGDGDGVVRRTTDMKYFISQVNRVLYSGPGSHRPRKCAVVSNPFGGKGNATEMYKTVLQPFLKCADIQVKYVESTSTEHIREIAESMETGVDCIVCVGGDGLVNQLLHGLKKRDDWEKMQKIPIGVLPGGSQNALLISVNGKCPDEVYAWSIIRGETTPLDVLSVENNDTGDIVYCLVAAVLGLPADILEDSENYRWMGPTRYQFSGVKKFFSMSPYKTRISYVPEGHSLEVSSLSDGESSAAQHEEESTSSESMTTSKLTISGSGTGDYAAIPLHQGEGERHRSSSSSKTLFKDSDWYQVDKEVFSLVGCFNVSGSNTQLGPQAPAVHNDGLVTLLMWENSDPVEAIRYMISQGDGTHTDLPFVTVIHARAVRLEPMGEQFSSPLNVDGELHPKGPITVTCLPSHLQFCSVPTDQYV